MRQTILDAGGDPNPGKTDILNRNKQIYREIKSGRKAIDIADQYKISAARISEICLRIDRILKTRKWGFPQHKDLLKYKNTNKSLEKISKHAYI